ncbi:MAG: threonylcarbamoyl-AMP synthase [Omnitrophica WOR_2 bacterium GWF2_43_52]|nr:MAG: threonylcarbamoyl-AMP synthase [Omnitrophica WOR_2 bacterium GWF2_43_52]HAH20244.1 threonylcarbamoyl-AMP synthase [Candidatus Omnitrophota bacterium]HBG63352.1 threonylcarbamoyl-AMP synthase [Candidatus Omnitrophota bacterium]
MRTEVIKVDPNNLNFEAIEKAARFIREGKLVAIPTETVYGVAADYNNRQALARLYELKGRPKDKPFTVAVATKDSLEIVALDVPVVAYKFADKFWPGPLTVVLKSANHAIGDEQRNTTIGLRVPKHNVALHILEMAMADVALPSANPSQALPARSAQEVLRYFDGTIDLVIDSGPSLLGVESSVVDLTKTPFVILREGALSKELLEKAAQTKRVLFICTGNSCRSVMAQGLLSKVLREKNRVDVEVLSAGVGAFNGLAPTSETLALLSREGVNLSAYRSQRVNRIMLKSSDLILVMDAMQQARVVELAPNVEKRVYLLKEFARLSLDNVNIPDPIGQGMDYYEKTFFTIKEAIEKIVTLL